MSYRLKTTGLADIAVNNGHSTPPEQIPIQPGAWAYEIIQPDDFQATAWLIIQQTFGDGSSDKAANSGN